MWYVIQTRTGDEEKLACMIRELVPRDHYTECFYIKMESARKSEDRWEIYLCPMFPGYLFVDTDTPKDMYFDLKKVPKLTKLLKEDGETFLPVSEEEQKFLEDIQSEGHIVRRSLVQVDDEKQIISAEGAVGLYLKNVVRQRVRKRYVLIERELLGEKRTIKFGIRLEEDQLMDV
uniref:transcription termination/antitermination NusG family protein n=1 Tax=Lachnoclostridium phocaeense TaxID=1871021 RepID=UPI0026DC415D|nr:transcription termination/antitermination NusG family protein [Lachnoclostridium phocaeense]